MEFNKYQSSLEELNLEKYPEEIREQFFDFINNVPFIKYLISPTRPHASDLPKDETGKIIFDVTKPPLLDNMDYFRPAALKFKKTGRYTDLRPNSNPNSEYGKWIREEIRRCYEGMVRPSDGMWITGDMYFMLNYFPMFITKINGKNKKGERVIDFPEVWEGINMRLHYIDQAINGGIYNNLGGQNGCEISSRGKAHPNFQIVYTPEGKTTWGNINIGDYLYTEKGLKTKVINIPYIGYDDIYKITLKDKRIVYASKEHLWEIWNFKKKNYDTLTTIDILSNIQQGIKISILDNKGVCWEHKNTPIDAYTLGLLLTNKKIDNTTFRQVCKYIPYQLKREKDYHNYIIKIPNVEYSYKELGLSKDNLFIPDIYKYNDYITRTLLLQGLFDAQGYVDNKGIPSIKIEVEQLAKDILLVLRSLGFNCLSYTYRKRNKKYYTIKVHTLNRLFLSKKQKRVKDKYFKDSLFFSEITNIAYSHKELCHCVTVDNKTNCYLIGDFITTHNSKSYTMAAMMSKRFVLGESKEVNKGVKCMATAYQKQYLTSDGILNKFQSGIDFLAQNTQFPKRRLKSSLQDMTWKMGYIDLNTGTQKGTLNEVIGVSAKDDSSKVRGKRQNLIVIEEFGSFRNVLELYNILIPSVQEGDISFGSMYLIGTAGDDESDFQGAQEIVYNPKGYRMYGIPNVFDKEGQGRKDITFFFPGYINRKGCYDKDGNSDVTKALLEILENRYRVKYNSTDINSITKTIAEIPITPQEAIFRTKGNLFPITQLNERIIALDSNPKEYNDVYVGTLVQRDNGTVEFKPTNDIPIRDFPTKDNKVRGAIEIFQMPEKDKNGKVFSNRYILGHDPVDDDTSNTMSLTSTFVLDLFTDKIVAEYTGRQSYADDNFEIVRLLCLFYNGKCLYEQNKKGIFAYFSQRNCVYLLADTPTYLKDKMIIKEIGYGNKAKGVNATAAVNNFANERIKNWLIKPVITIIKEDGVDKEVTVPNLHFIRNRALLKELVLFNPDINVDRVRALGMVMLYREEFMILYQGNINSQRNEDAINNSLANDPFFVNNYDKRFSSKFSLSS